MGGAGRHLGTTVDLTGEGGVRMLADTKVELLEGDEDTQRSHLAVSEAGSIVAAPPENIQPSDDGEWSANECRTLLDAVKLGEPFRLLGVYANMWGYCRKQLDHIKQRVEPGIACLAARGSAQYVDVLLVANAAILKQATYGLQFTTISEAMIMSLMGKSRRVVFHATHVASAEPRGPQRTSTV